MNSSIKVTENITGNIPQHIAIIMDGNGRWAKKRGNIRLIGHKKGVNTVNDIVTESVQIGVKYLTLYAFSTENWARPADEVSGLMDLLISALDKNLQKLLKNNVKLQTIGDLSKIPPRTANKLQEGIEKTKNNSGLTLTIALNYSSRWEITHMVKLIAKEVKDKNIQINNISEDTISKYLSTKNIPDPELLIRTSGEFRISNFLLWQIAYTELYFTDILWPDFSVDEFKKAIIDYQNRERRFGKTGEQVK